MNSQKTTLRIRTIDSEVHEFVMPASEDNGLDYTIGSRLEKLLNQRSIALAVEDRVSTKCCVQAELIRRRFRYELYGFLGLKRPAV